MSDHYYTENPQSSSSPVRWTVCIKDVFLTFQTDHGVFSRERVDDGTRLLVESAHIPPHARVLDLGCGYGAVGVSVLKTSETALVTMLDVNARAVALADQNAQINHVRDRARILCGDAVEVLRSDEQAYDVILLNPPIRAGKSVVFTLYEMARSRLDPEGALYVVIQKKQGAPSTEDKLKTLFHRVEHVARHGGYRVCFC
ncbi:class I SAM-dependent methyltransferase [Ferroacidibacillus organovorans]|uniref:Methyltransferase small domain-containing protein n=1 Tax=Ferroacidibacillus organovorans TaxID=1765683 RepID=A0A101XPP6_9BACL|nr:methyltransferase [Ferroacidibacillus organovorans]KUO95107.1 hypothetical protein ATW55_13675 [Ferroacidibacillus organovorans]